MKDLFTVAQVLRPHGRRGEVVVRPLTDHIETLTDAATVYLGQKAIEPVPVESIRLHKGHPLLKLQGVDDIDGALALKGIEICLPGEELTPLDEGEYFLHDLVGLTLLDHKGELVGPVDNFVQTGGPPLLTGTRADGKEFMVPFASGTIDEVDLEGGTIRLVDLPGLIEE
jgi:16S rRNA processing protein RimM